MSKRIQYARQQIKAVSSGGFTAAPSSDHTDGTWDEHDIYQRELGWDADEQILYIRDPLTDAIVAVAASQVWTTILASLYTATPASTTTITTAVDLSNYVQVGDVLKITIAGVTQYNQVYDITASLITVSGVELSDDIDKIEFERGNRARIQSIVLEIDQENFLSWGEDRPNRSATPGAVVTTPTDPWGTNVFYEQWIRLTQGAYMVGARVTLADCGSSATALELGIGFGSQADYACSISCDALENVSTIIDKAYYQVLSSNVLDKVDVTTNAGNKDVSQVEVHLQFFTDISEA